MYFQCEKYLQIILDNFLRYGGYSEYKIGEVLDRLGLDDPDRVPGSLTQEHTKSTAPSESKGVSRDPVLVIRNVEVTTVIQELSKVTNKRGDGDVIIIDLILSYAMVAILT